MLTQHNCFDNALHTFLKQNMDITANFCSFLDFIRPDQDLIKIYDHTEWFTRVRN